MDWTSACTQAEHPPLSQLGGALDTTAFPPLAPSCSTSRPRTPSALSMHVVQPTMNVRLDARIVPSPASEEGARLDHSHVVVIDRF